MKAEEEYRKDEKQDRKALISLIGIIVVLFFLLIITSCKKKETAPKAAGVSAVQNPCNIDTSLLTNRTWIPVNLLHTTIKFESLGNNYYQAGSQYGIWSMTACDSVKIQRPTSSFYFRLISITNDTLVLSNIAQVLKYHL